MDSAYNPMEPARSPGGKPLEKPKYRVLVHRKYAAAWEQIVERVGLKQARHSFGIMSRSRPDPKIQ